MPTKKKGNKASEQQTPSEDGTAATQTSTVAPPLVPKSEAASVTVIAKRLRAARKKLGRIQELEASLESGDKHINADQEELLRSKPGLLCVIEELEKVIPLLKDASKEELDQVREQAVADTLAEAAAANEAAVESAVAEAVAKARADAEAATTDQKQALEEAAAAERDAAVADAVSNMLQLIYFSQLFSQPLSSQPEMEACVSYDKGEDGEPVSEKDLLDIAKLGQLVTSRTNKLRSHKDALEDCTQLAHKWLSSSDEEVPELGVTVSLLKERLERVMASDYFTTEPERRVLEGPIEMGESLPAEPAANPLPPYMPDRGLPLHHGPPPPGNPQAPTTSGGQAILDDPAIAYVSTTAPPVQSLPHSSGLQAQQQPPPHFGLAHLGIPTVSYSLPYVPQPMLPNPNHPNQLHPSIPHYPMPTEANSGFGSGFGAASVEPRREPPAAGLISGPEVHAPIPIPQPDMPIPHANGGLNPAASALAHQPPTQPLIQPSTQSLNQSLTQPPPPSQPLNQSLDRSLNQPPSQSPNPLLNQHQQPFNQQTFNPQTYNPQSYNQQSAQQPSQQPAAQQPTQQPTQQSLNHQPLSQPAAPQLNQHNLNHNLSHQPPIPHPIAHTLAHHQQHAPSAVVAPPLSHSIPAPPPPPKPLDLVPPTSAIPPQEPAPSAPPLPVLPQAAAVPSFPIPQPYPRDRSFERGGGGRRGGAGGGGRGPRGPRQDRNLMPTPHLHGLADQTSQLSRQPPPQRSDQPAQPQRQPPPPRQELPIPAQRQPPPPRSEQLPQPQRNEGLRDISRPDREGSNGGMYGSGHREGGLPNRGGRGGVYRGRGGQGGPGRGKQPAPPQGMMGQMMNGMGLGQMPIPHGTPMMPPQILPYQ